MGSTRIPTSELFSLEGKNVIATGGLLNLASIEFECFADRETATGGLGSEMCLAMAEAGADIVSIQIPRDKAEAAFKRSIEGVGRKLATFECNLADSAALRETFHKIWDAGVVPDILLNCGGLNKRGLIKDMKDPEIDLVRQPSALNVAGWRKLGPSF
jgi:2-deoxy-D-gluconate 3-dehydrogenase